MVFFFIFSATYSYTVTQTEAKNEILINRIIRFVSYFFVSSPCLSFIRISRSSLRSVDRSSCEGTTLAFEKSFVFSPNLTTSGKTSGVQGIVFTKIAEKQKKGQNSFLATCALFDSSGVRFALVSSSCSFAASGKPLFMSFNKIPMPKPIDTDSRFASDRVAVTSFGFFPIVSSADSNH